MTHETEIAQRMRGMREDCGYSKEQMAAQLSMDAAEYEAYENGQSEIPVSVMHDFCRLVGIDLTELITGSAPKLSHISIVRKGQGVGSKRNAAYGYENLAYNFAGRRMQPFLVTIPPGDGGEMPVNVHSGHEYHYCLEGRFRMRIGHHEFILEEGDSVYFESTSPHGIQALDGKPAKSLVIIV